MQIHQRRWLHLDTPLGADVFTVLQFRGREALSEPFRRVDILNDLTHQVQGNETLRIDGHHQLTLQSAPARFQARRLYLSGGGSTLCLDEQGVTLKGSALSGGRVNLLTRGASPMFPLARQGDPHQCPKREAGIAHEGGAVLQGAEGIQANGFPIARLGDAADCRIGQSLIQEGIASLQVGGQPAARAALRFLHKAWQDYHALHSGTHNDDTHIAMLAAKLRDPAAGWIYAMVADMADLLDQYLVPLSHTHRKLCSIYHLANLYTFPFSWFLQDIATRSEAFFQSWRVAYKDSGWQQVVDGKAHKQPFSATWAQQIEKLRATYPQAFKFFQMCVREYQEIREGKHYYWKHPINTYHYMRTFPLLYPSYALAKTLGLAFAQDYARKLAGNPLVQALEQHHETLVAVILLGLLTPDAASKPALGWKGAAPEAVPSGGYAGVNQKDWLPDHSGMLVPNQKLFDEIYVKKLFKEDGPAFTHFGKWK